MAESDKLKVSLILLGKEANPVLEILSKVSNIDLKVICATFLNYELPRSEDKKSIIVRDELIQTLKSISDDFEKNFPIPPTIKNSYMEDLNGIESEDDIGIIYNINTIEDHSTSLVETFDGLEELIGEGPFEILPLTDEDDDIIVYRNKKWAPLRYYLVSKKLPFDESKYNAGEKKVKMTGKSLHLYGVEELKDDKLPEETAKILEESDIILISSTDVISVAILMKLASVLKQIRKVAKVDKSLLIWPTEDVDEQEDEVLSKIGYSSDISSFLKDFSSFIDYVVLDQDSDIDLDSIMEHGAKYITEKLPRVNSIVAPSQYTGLIESLFSIGESSLTPEFSTEVEEEDSLDTEKNETEITTENGTTKSIEQLKESEKEAGIQKVPKDDLIIEEEPPIIETKVDEDKSGSDIQVDKSNESNPKSVPEEPETAESKYDPDVSESWEDALKRAIQVYISEEDEVAYNWIIKQLDRDSDLRENISQILMNRILVAEGSAAKKETITLLKKMYEHIKQSVVQVFSAYLLNTITSKEFEKTRDFVYIFNLLQSEMIGFCEDITKSIIKDITAKREDPLVFEMSKLTLVQMVINSRRLKRIAISRILTIMDARIDSSPTYLWNFLMCFDAGSVAVELVTQFSISRSEELINRTPLLRYTGSYFTTLQMVMTYWKAGDQLAIKEITGSILPDNTIRKLERMDLASKIEKLGTVPLSTLAKTLGKEPETIERLIAELIMNDNIDVRLEVVDNRMIVMYNPKD